MVVLVVMVVVAVVLAYFACCLPITSRTATTARANLPLFTPVDRSTYIYDYNCSAPHARHFIVLDKELKSKEGTTQGDMSLRPLVIRTSARNL